MVHKTIRKKPQSIKFWLPEKGVESKGEVVAHIVLDEYGRAFIVNPFLKTGRATTSLIFR